MAENNKKAWKADIYNIARILIWIVCIGVPLRLWYNVSVSVSTNGVPVALVVSLIAVAILVPLELLVFRKVAKKLDTKPAVTQGNMYNRTTESYRSAFDDIGAVEEKKRKNKI